MADDEPFYAPFKKPPPPRQPKPGELLMTFEYEHVVYRVEPRDFNPYGIEAQILVNGELWQSCRFSVRALAVRWAEQKRAAILRGEMVEWP